MNRNIHKHLLSNSLQEQLRRILCLPFRGVGFGVLCGLLIFLFSCEREPKLHLHEGEDIDSDIPVIDLQLEVYWDYEMLYGVKYDWQAEWFYGWDAEDSEIFGEMGYTEPSIFNIRRYFTGQISYAHHTNYDAYQITGKLFHAKYNFGYYDILIWNDIQTIDGVQSLIFDESTSLDSVLAYTHQSMLSARYNAPRYTRAFYQPEALFSAYSQAIGIIKGEIDEAHGFTFSEERNAWVKTLDMQLEPITYIYLTQVILHHNNGRISSVDGSARLSGMAQSVCLNNGIAGSDPVTVSYNVRLKKNCKTPVDYSDIIGGRVMTFGMCSINANRVKSRADTGESYYNDGQHHFMDVTVQFNNGMDSTIVFDVTDQVRKRYKGGVLTVELDMDTVPIPKRSGGSGFDAVVKDYEDGGTHEFDMSKRGSKFED